jgi:hypothetical protein
MVKACGRIQIAMSERLVRVEDEGNAMFYIKFQWAGKNLRPITPARIKPIHSKRIASRGSLNSKIPRPTVPKVPSPVHTA